MGEGYNVNIAWTQDMMGNAEYMAAFDHVVMPIAKSTILNCNYGVVLMQLEVIRWEVATSHLRDMRT